MPSAAFVCLFIYILVLGIEFRALNWLGMCSQHTKALHVNIV